MSCHEALEGNKELWFGIGAEVKIDRVQDGPLQLEELDAVVIGELFELKDMDKGSVTSHTGECLCGQGVGSLEGHCAPEIGMKDVMTVMGDKEAVAECLLGEVRCDELCHLEREQGKGDWTCVHLYRMTMGLGMGILE